MLNPNDSPIPEYPCLRKLAERAGRDPAGLDEAAVRAHLLYCKSGLNYAPSSMRAACAALRFLYHTVLGRDWKLFDLVRCADHHRLPVVLTREEVARLFAVVRLPRFRTFLRLVYGCGLRLSEGLALEVDSIKQNGTCLFIRRATAMASALSTLPGLRPGRHRPDQTPGPRSAMMPAFTACPRPLRPRSLPPPTASHRFSASPHRHTPNHRPRTIQARLRPGSTAKTDRLRAPAPEPPANIPAATPIAEPAAKKQNA